MVRGLTPKERKEVFKETGCTLTNFSEERFEELMMKVNEIVAPDKDFKNFKEESDFFNEVVKMTYSVTEKEEKN